MWSADLYPYHERAAYLYPAPTMHWVPSEPPDWSEGTLTLLSSLEKRDWFENKSIKLFPIKYDINTDFKSLRKFPSLLPVLQDQRPFGGLS